MGREGREAAGKHKEEAELGRPRTGDRVQEVQGLGEEMEYLETDGQGGGTGRCRRGMGFPEELLLFLCFFKLQFSPS